MKSIFSLKATVKWQLERDGELYGKVYDRFFDAKEDGEMLTRCGWIKKYNVVATRAKWLKA